MASGEDDKPPRDPQRTVFQPSGRPETHPPGPQNAGASSWTPGASQAPVTGSAASYGAARPSSRAGQIVIGSVLNDIYEVRRFIGRGGMGEVYEGINVNTGERVAIKVILAHLAQDPKVQALFRAEANVLTRLTHEALVQYRLMAREPVLDVLYIVTDFVDGVCLEDLIGQVRLSTPELKSLLRRLAEGLSAAHARNVFHRDISPDNILLPERRLDAAKIIDFGIAKDLQTSQATIIGAGFAGKLNYVAPEQLGDFGHNIGPWTDIYSLGLVMLSMAAGRPVDMGSNPVEAVDKRRAGPDLGVLPPELRPIFQRMLAADPALRFHSMAEVMAALDEVDGRGPATAPPAYAAPPPPYTPPSYTAPPYAAPSYAPAPAPADPRAASTDRPPPPARPPASRTPLLIAVTVGVLVLAAGLAFVLFGGKHATGPAGPVAIGGAPPPPASEASVIDGALASASCSWMDYDLTHDQSGMGMLTLTGAAGDPGAAGQSLRAAVEKSGQSLSFNTRGVAPLPPSACAQVDAFRAFRASSSGADPWITPQASDFRPEVHAECHNDASQALAIVEGDLGAGGDDDVAMIVMSPDGELHSVFNGASGFDDLQRAISSGASTGVASKIGDRQFSVGLCEHDPGLYGVALVRGRGPFDLGLSPAGVAGGAPQPGDFALRFQRAAQANGWRTQMGWYQIDEASAVTPSAPAAPAAPVAAPPQAAAPVEAPSARHRRETRPAPATAPVKAAPRPAKPKPPPALRPVELGGPEAH